MRYEEFKIMHFLIKEKLGFSERHGLMGLKVDKSDLDAAQI